jgi:hypothetical protein
MGDRIQEGAFDETLSEWKKKGDPIPIILAHDWNNPFAHIGYVQPDSVKSVPGVGLVVEEGHLDIEDNPTAAQVHKLMQRKSLKEFSFGYSIPKGGMRKAMDGAFDLTKLNLMELGPCLRGVNDQTQLLSIKSQLDAEDREMTVEERLARVEAEIEVKASDGPPQAAYDPQKAKASMAITGNSFVTKVNEATAADAMKEVLALLGKVPPATPKAEFAGTKAVTMTGASPDVVSPGVQPATGTAGYDQVRALRSMIEQGKEFIVNEEEQADVDAMSSIITALQALLVTEQAEPATEEAAKSDEDREVKAETVAIDYEREFADLQIRNQLHEMETDYSIKEVLDQGSKTDNYLSQIQNLEDEISS